MDFQYWLKFYREQAGYKQAKDFAEKLGIPYTRYISYENKGSEPKYEVLCRIADELGVSVDQLLGHSNNFEQCKKKVESTNTMKVSQKENGKIVVTFAYDKETVELIEKRLAEIGSKSVLTQRLRKEDKIFDNVEEFCNVVNKTRNEFWDEPDNQERWETLFDAQYVRYEMENEFNKHSRIKLEAWQIKSISSAMWESLTNKDPKENTPERIQEKQKMIDDFFKRQNRKTQKNIKRIPKGFGELFRNY